MLGNIDWLSKIWLALKDVDQREKKRRQSKKSPLLSGSFLPTMSMERYSPTRSDSRSLKLSGIGPSPMLGLNITPIILMRMETEHSRFGAERKDWKTYLHGFGKGAVTIRVEPRISLLIRDAIQQALGADSP